MPGAENQLAKFQGQPPMAGGQVQQLDIVLDQDGMRKILQEGFNLALKFT
jgi:hypothetical protein